MSDVFDPYHGRDLHAHPEFVSPEKPRKKPWRVFHCCGWAVRCRLPSNRFVTCRTCGKQMTAEISGAALAAYLLGGWEAIAGNNLSGVYRRLNAEFEQGG